MNEHKMTIKELIAITMADIDIKLLMEKDQETDKNEMFSVEQIREQLLKSGAQMLAVLKGFGYNVDGEIAIMEQLELDKN